MDFASLQDFCKEVHDEISKLDREISSQSSTNCEQDMMAMLQSSAERYVLEKRQYRDQLRQQCKTVLEEIIKKSQLIGESFAMNSYSNEQESLNVNSLVVPPFKPLLNQLMLELEQLNSKVSERSHRRNKLWAMICEYCERLSIALPAMPDSLNSADLQEYEAQAGELRTEVEMREKCAREFLKRIAHIKNYLGEAADEALADFSKDALNAEVMSTLEDRFGILKLKYEVRKQEVGEMEDHITSLANALDVPLELPSTAGGPGSEERQQKLRERLKELNALKLEKLDIFVENSRARIVQLWDELSLDRRQRRKFEDSPASENLLADIEQEVLKLEAMLKDPARQGVLSILSRYKQIKVNESKLEEMSRDPGRLARRGFAASLKQEERLRRFNNKNKPEVIEALKAATKEWASQHDGESFCIDDRDICEIISEEIENSPSAKRRVSLTRKRPNSVETVPAKRVKAPATSINSSSTTQSQSVRAAASMPSLKPGLASQRKIPPRTNSAAVRPNSARPIAAANSLANARTLPYKPSATRNIPNRADAAAPNSQTARSAAAFTNKRPLMPAKPSHINLPSTTPGRPNNFMLRNKQAVQRVTLPQTQSTRIHASMRALKPVPNQPRAQRRSAECQKENAVPAPSWESEEFQKMQNLEISYFDDTSIQDTANSRKSFDYERDAF